MEVKDLIKRLQEFYEDTRIYSCSGGELEAAVDSSGECITLFFDDPEPDANPTSCSKYGTAVCCKNLKDCNEDGFECFEEIK